MTTNDDLNKTLVKFSNNLSFFFRNGLLLLVLFLVSCGREATTQSESKTETKDTLNAKDTALPEKPAFTSTAYGSSLNIETFHFLADSFLTALNGTKVKLKLITDTLPSDTNRRSLIRPLFLPGNARVVRHRFEPENDFSILRIRLLSAFYTDTTTASMAFAGLCKDAYENGGEGNHTPGLSYTNDFVVKTDAAIFWVNTGCPYAGFNMRKIKSLFLRALKTSSIKDSINCRCGAARCEENRK